MARVNQNKGTAQGLTPGQVLFQQPLPFFHDRHGCVGKAVSRQIDQVMRLAQSEIV